MTKTKENTEERDLPERIVFYDGDCGFCNTSVQFVLNKRKRPIYFAALQSKLAEEKLGSRGVSIQMNTLYFLENDKLYQKSSGALRIARHLKGGYPLLYYVGIIFPRFFRDWIYDQVAKRRHKIKPGYCAMPSPDERKLFIGD